MNKLDLNGSPVFHVFVLLAASEDTWTGGGE